MSRRIFYVFDDSLAFESDLSKFPSFPLLIPKRQYDIILAEDNKQQRQMTPERGPKTVLDVISLSVIVVCYRHINDNEYH